MMILNNPISLSSINLPNIEEEAQDRFCNYHRMKAESISIRSCLKSLSQASSKVKPIQDGPHLGNNNWAIVNLKWKTSTPNPLLSWRYAPSTSNARRSLTSPNCVQNNPSMISWLPSTTIQFQGLRVVAATTSWGILTSQISQLLPLDWALQHQPWNRGKPLPLTYREELCLCQDTIMQMETSLLTAKQREQTTWSAMPLLNFQVFVISPISQVSYHGDCLLEWFFFRFNK